MDVRFGLACVKGYSVSGGVFFSRSGWVVGLFIQHSSF